MENVHEETSASSGSQPISGLVEQLKTALKTAQPGSTLLAGVHRSQFEVLCTAVDQRGLSFSTTTTSLDQPDPLGTVSLELDPNQTHDCAAHTFGLELNNWFLVMGVRRLFNFTGSGRFPFTPGRSKEPDFSLKCEPSAREEDPPLLVVECAESQASSSLERDVATWVRPRPEGGGASIAVGLDVKFRGARTELPVLKARLHLAGRHTAVQELSYGAGTACGTEGDPRFFLWLPLPHLLPGAGLVMLAWCSMVVVLWGVGQGALAWLRMPPWQAFRLTVARCRSPWGRLPVDMSHVAQAVARLRGLQFPCHL